jgi:hypothetical protein
VEDDGRSPRLDDDELAEEITLYGDLMVAASEADGDLSLREIDELLGLDEDSSPPSGVHRGERRSAPGKTSGFVPGAALP